MKRKVNFYVIRVLGMVLLILVAVFCLYKAVNKMGNNEQAESLKQLDSSIRKATMTCYAAEGVYPPTVQYLVDNYGIQLDESRFVVFYEVFGDNLMPNITVLERQE